MSTKVYRYRVKSLSGLLNKQARAVNFVWNFCNDTQKHALKWGKKWPSNFDLDKLTAGSSKELRLHAGTINAITAQYAKSRKQANRAYLRYRGKRSLGWIPLKGRDIKQVGDSFRFANNTYRVFYSRPLPQGKIKDGTCFAQDAKGNWYLNIVVEVADDDVRPIRSGVGIDLGLQSFATLSNGDKIENPRHFRTLEERLAKAQRSRKRRQALKIHAKIRNARSDFLHKLSTRLVQDFDYISVGDVNAKGLAKTKLAKSVNDAAWSSFRNMLRYKAITHGATVEEVSEAFSSRTCSRCGSVPDSSPKGMSMLRIREWQCSDCGTFHDRDVNAAMNILRSGRRAPVVGTPVR